nr:exosporium glycoprotein BclB-related protein [uncultured Bacillus sp.]
MPNGFCEPCGIIPLGPLVSPNPRCLCPVLSGAGGTAGGGAIIPYSSGVVPAVLTFVLGGLLSTSTIVGFGTSIPGISIAGGVIDTTGLLNIAFTVPRAGTITGIAANFQITLALDLLGSTAAVNATLFRAISGTNVFAPIPGATVQLQPSLTGTLAIGTLLSGITALSAPVAAGDRLMMVFTAVNTSGIPIAAVITGNASAGVNIV